MKALTSLPLLYMLLLVTAQTTAQPSPMSSSDKRLGTVQFPVSCKASSQAPFNRGVALLHDFWYGEARAQFDRIATNDPGCAMAHWGVGMSIFHEIWGQPDAAVMALGWQELQKAQSLHASTVRERAYISALADFYRPGDQEYPARIAAYVRQMGSLAAQYPDDVDASAFHALALLAAEAPGDTSLSQEHKAMAVLTPLFVKYPDNPGVVHYIIHACDNPALAADGLAAANHYGEIAQSGPHAFHMPGHIYARLGLWQQDIASQLGSIAAAQAAETHGESAVMDEPHSYDFLLYAYLQTGQDDRAQSVLHEISSPLQMIASMPSMGSDHMPGMVPYYQVKLTIFYALEMRDWKSAAEVRPAAGSSPEVAILAYWARAVAHGRLHQPTQAQTDLIEYDKLIAELRKSKSSYLADGTAVKIERAEILAWIAFAQGNSGEAITQMRSAADLQDKVGQGEVDIPAREMLADILLESNHPEQALVEYELALRLSPNRLNGLYNAGRAAEAIGNKQRAETYYALLLRASNNGANSSRPEFEHARSFIASAQNAKN